MYKKRTEKIKYFIIAVLCKKRKLFPGIYYTVHIVNFAHWQYFSLLYLQTILQGLKFAQTLLST